MVETDPGSDAKRAAQRQAARDDAATRPLGPLEDPPTTTDVPLPFVLDALIDPVEQQRVFDALFHGSKPVERLGRHVLLGPLGQGGMGVVLEAFDRALDRRIAIKVLHRNLDERHARRLVREAQALAKLSHPNVVQVYDVGESGGQTFIAMELVSGRSLRDWARARPRRGWRECVEVYVQAGQGLAAAHARGVIHRDFKPGNAIIDDDGRVRVLDFGLARLATDASEQVTALSVDAEPTAPGTSLTGTGTVMGTPAYMPLEQMRGEEVDARSDQFSLCVSLYEALYGERPFEGSSLGALMLSVGAGQLRPAPSGSPVPGTLRRILQRGLAPEPEERWPSMDALLVELRRTIAPRTRRGVAVGLMAGLVVMGVGLAQYAEVGFRCEGARDELAGIWNDARRVELREAILGTGVSHAPQTWSRIEQQVDDYAEAWASKHTEVCTATRVAEQQSEGLMDLRMGCLSSARIALREALAILAQANETRVHHAAELVSKLPMLRRCDDVEALRAELPPPEDPRVAARVEDLREQVQGAYALAHAGEYELALEIARPAVEEAETLDYAPLRAEALVLRGGLLRQRDQNADAEEDLVRAYVLATEVDHRRVQEAAASSLTRVVGVELARPEQGKQWGLTARALARDDLAEARSSNAVGAVLSHEGKLEDALEHHQHALALVERARGPAHYDVSEMLNNNALVLWRLGRLDEAFDQFERSLAIMERVVGSEHPEMVVGVLNLGVVKTSQGDHQEALAYFRRGLAIAEQDRGFRQSQTAQLLDNMGNALAALGRSHEALSCSRRALEIRERIYGREHHTVGIALGNIGVVLSDIGERDEALAHHRRSVAILERTLGPDHLDTAHALEQLGAVELDMGHRSESLAHQRQALAAREARLGPEHPDVAWSLCNVGAALTELGDQSGAREAFQRALAIRETHLGPEHPDVAYALLGLADVYLAEDDFEAARDHAARAVSIRESSEVSAESLAVARYSLALALWAEPAERARARSLVELARDAYATLGDGRHDDVVRMQTWLDEHARDAGAAGPSRTSP